jgi:hypothetical protein
VFSIKGGNSQLAAAMIKAAGAVLHTAAPMSRVTRDPATGTFLLTAAQVEGAAAQQQQAVLGPYDAVVVAVPLELSGLVLEGFEGLGGRDGAAAAAAAAAAGGLRQQAVQLGGEPQDGEALVAGQCSAAAAGAAAAGPHQRVYQQTVTTYVAGEVGPG